MKTLSIDEFRATCPPKEALHAAMIAVITGRECVVGVRDGRLRKAVVRMFESHGIEAIDSGQNGVAVLAEDINQKCGDIWEMSSESEPSTYTPEMKHSPLWWISMESIPFFNVHSARYILASLLDGSATMYRLNGHTTTCFAVTTEAAKASFMENAKKDALLQLLERANSSAFQKMRKFFQDLTEVEVVHS